MGAGRIEAQGRGILSQHYETVISAVAPPPPPI